MEPSRRTAFNRRAFLKLGSLGAAAALAPRVGAQEPAAPPAAATGEAQPECRTLGRTGLSVSAVSIGAMRTTEPAVLQAAFDRGVNYVDTAHCYMGGRNEVIVGEAIKGRRDKLHVATKVHVAPKADMIQSVEASLKSLGTDYVDVIQLHMPDVSQIHQPEVHEALAQLKKDGKVRFVGVTTHSNEEAILDAVTDDRDHFYDTVLVAYSFKSRPTVKEAIARAAKAKVGIVAMKTQAGGYETSELGAISPHQAALKWVLSDSNVTTAVPAMVDLKQVTEDTEVMGTKLSRTEQQVLERYAAAIAPYYCHRCGACGPTCPHGVDIRTINRCTMYWEGYRDPALAQETYRRIPRLASAAVCADCAACAAKCVNGLNLQERMQTARQLFV